ncbi:MAG: hypothetical protein IK062_02410 [Selenomonadaceae bacterium]|nr:hypothetical protein [Selenomonadaceae bacterium]
MHEGILVWHGDSIAAKYFSNGELIFEKITVGQEVELFQNGFWHKVKIHSTTDEPYIEDWNYGNCLGCEVRIGKIAS